MIDRLTRFVVRRAKIVLLLSVIALAALGIAGVGVADKLQAGGYVDPQAEAIRAYNHLSDDFGRDGLPLVLAVSAPNDVRSEGADYARTLIERLRGEAEVQSVTDGFATPTPMLVSRDGKTALVVAAIQGGDSQAPVNAKAIVKDLPAPPAPITMTPGGEVYSYAQINDQSSRDLLIAEGVAIPITFLVLVWVFGGLVAAAIPVLIGIAAIIATTGILRAFTTVTDVSVFALNLTTAMGLALAIDYTLLGRVAIYRAGFLWR